MSEVLGAAVIGTAQAYEYCYQQAGIRKRDIYAGTPWQNGKFPSMRDLVLWSDYTILLRAVFAHSEEELGHRNIALAFLNCSPALRVFPKLLAAIVSPIDIYRMVYGWIGGILYKNIVRNLQILPDKTIKIELSLLANNEPCAEYFHLVELCIVTQCHIIGCGDATVIDLERSGIGIKIHIIPPPSPTWIARFLRFFHREREIKGALTLDVGEQILVGHTEALSAEQSLGVVLEQMPDGLAIIELGGSRIKEVNQAFCKFLEREKAEIIRSSFFDFVAMEEHEKLSQMLHNPNSSDGIEIWFELKTEDGNRRRKQIEVRYGSGLRYKKETCFFLTLRDLSNIKQLENKLSQQQRLALLGELNAGISHELTTPLTVTLSNLEILLDHHSSGNHSDNNADQALLQAIHRNLNHVAAIVQSYSRAARQSRKNSHQNESLSQLVKEAMTLCQAKARRAAVEMRLIHTGEVRLQCRSHEIMQIITNLLNNAIDAAQTTKERYAEVKIDDFDSYARLRISDSGRIEEPSIKERMMEPFFTTKDGGMGLGLTLTRQLIEGHGGRIYLDPTAERTTFIVDLKKDYLSEFRSDF